MSQPDIIRKISTDLELKEFQVHNVVQLMFEEECTIPFVARYRKEKTGSMDEVQIKEVRDRYSYQLELAQLKERYLKVVQAHCDQKPEFAGQFPKLKDKFLKCETKQALEDLYLPFKPKRRTRSQIAKEKGLAALLSEIKAGAANLSDLNKLAQTFIDAHNPTADDDKKIKDAAEALSGASDIFAEEIAETAELRQLVRGLVADQGSFASRKVDAVIDADKLSEATPAQKTLFEKAQKFKDYFEFKEPVKTAASHRIMAARRGESEKVLRVLIDIPADEISTELKSEALKTFGTCSAQTKEFFEDSIQDAFKRLIWPSIETEVRLELKKRAETDAIDVFSKNLSNLLLLPPIPGKVVMGIDPGLRTGSKLAVVDRTGKLLGHETIHPDLRKMDAENSKNAKAIAAILKLLKAHKVEYIAIGNGTGSREIDRLVRDVLKQSEMTTIKRLVVNEAGASVYSTDDIAREEFPDLDPTIRSAVSIARRLQDPLAELVKIDPKSIGVGQYQHDVNVTKLKNSLQDVVESCVNKVGVNLNTASFKLLSYVSGIGPSLAKSIVTHRNEKGQFNGRDSLMDVGGFGQKVFEQAAGFLRVPQSANPLDNSAVHPESYGIVQAIAKDQKKEINELIGDQAAIDAIPLENYVSEAIGLPTLQDISSELIKPGRDPRDEGTRLIYDDNISEIDDLVVDMKLNGTVTNVTNFGAFVDIGVHQDGLVHISELSDQFVKDPNQVVAVGDVIEVRVMEVDAPRKRISLSCKSSRKAGAQSPRGKTETKRPDQRGKRKPSAKSKPSKQYTMDDLLNKFNQNRS